MAKVLTVKNPWAWLIAQGIKDIENRTWRTHFRGRVFIHAAAGLTKGFYSEFLPKKYWESLNQSDSSNLIQQSSATVSQILCSVEIVDCVMNHPSIWAEKTEGITDSNTGEFIPKADPKPIWNWVLANPKPAPQFEGLKIKGALSLWDFTMDRIIGEEVDYV